MSPASLWNGAIGFGLVSIPVSLVTAVDRHDIPLHEVHAEDGGRVKRRRICQVCGREVPYSDVAKGYEDHAGHRVTLTDDDLAELPLPSKRLIDVLAFVDAHSIDPLRLDRGYYLAPQAGAPAGAKPYKLLVDALREYGQAAVTKVTISSRERLALLRVVGDMLVLNTMYWPDEIRAADEVPRPGPEVTVHPHEVQMAVNLMEAMSTGFRLAAAHDDYAAALRQLAESKIEHVPVPETAMPPTTTEPESIEGLMAALQASIRRHEQGPGEAR